MVSLKESDENKHNKSGPITARKDYLSDEDVGDKKNSFRKFILGAPDEIEDQTPLKESSSEQDVSLMHGLPASMKKLRQMSMDKSKHSVRRHVTDEYFKEQEESSEVDMDLKFLNKKTIKSKLSQSQPSLHKKVASQPVQKRKNPYSKFQSNKSLNSSVASHRGHSNKNVSFTMTPKHSAQQRIIGKPPRKLARGPEPMDYLEDEVRSEYVRESLSRVLPQHGEPLPQKDEPRRSRKSIGDGSLKRQKDELEQQRKYLRNKDQFDDSQ